MIRFGYDGVPGWSKRGVGVQYDDVQPLGVEDGDNLNLKNLARGGRRRIPTSDPFDILQPEYTYNKPNDHLTPNEQALRNPWPPVPGMPINDPDNEPAPQAATDAGAEVVVLCDTNGGSMPWEVEDIVRRVVNSTSVPVGIHAHNDCEMAVSNTLAAVQAGAMQVQGTVNGYGERTGNANLCSIIPNLKLKMGIECINDRQLTLMTDLSKVVKGLAKLSPSSSHSAYVGHSAFAHA